MEAGETSIKDSFTSIKNVGEAMPHLRFLAQNYYSTRFKKVTKSSMLGVSSKSTTSVAFSEGI